MCSFTTSMNDVQAFCIIHKVLLIMDFQDLCLQEVCLPYSRFTNVVLAKFSFRIFISMNAMMIPQVIPFGEGLFTNFTRIRPLTSM